MKRTKNFTWAVVALAIMWQSLSMVVGKEYFPNFFTILHTTFETVQTKQFWHDLIITLGILLISMTLTIIFSILLGSFIALNRKIEVATQDSLAFLRGIPSIVILPLLVSIQGNNLKTVIVAVTISSVAKLVVFVVDGFKSVDLDLIHIALIMKLSKRNRIFNLYIPSAIFSSLVSLKLISIISLTSIIAAGAISGAPGLGNALHLAEANANFNLIYTYVFILGLIGIFLNELLTKVESRIERRA